MRSSCQSNEKAKTGCSNLHPVSVGGAIQAATLLGGCSTATALSLSALRSVLFLDADETESASVLAEDTAALDGLIESTKKLLEAFVISNLNTHKLKSPPNQTCVITIKGVGMCGHTTTFRSIRPAPVIVTQNAIRVLHKSLVVCLDQIHHVTE